MQPGPASSAPKSGRPHARTVIAVGVVATATLGAAVGWLVSSGGSPAHPPAAAVPAPAVPAPAVPAAGSDATFSAALARTPAALPPVVASTETATVMVDAPRYSSPSHRTAGTVPATWYERPSVLPVIAARPGWVEVRLAQRPDESTAWVPDSDVTLGSTSYEIVVDLATTKLSLYDHGELVFSAPAGVGAEDDPTPTGQYFVAFHEQPPQPNPGYGPFIIVTSAHSRSISDWEGSGDAVTGIHGPLGEDKQIGTSGARISHGCIRLHDTALEKLADVPAGTPIEVMS